MPTFAKVYVNQTLGKSQVGDENGHRKPNARQDGNADDLQVIDAVGQLR